MPKTSLRLVVAVAVVVAVVAAPTASATTAPAILLEVKVTVTNDGIAFSRLRARRGWAAHFNVTNRSNRPLQVDIGGLQTRVLKPGQKGRVSASFESRGRYPYLVVGSTSPKQKGWFVVY